MNEQDTMALQIITASGSAKNFAMEAIRKFKIQEGNEAKKLLEESQKHLSQANQIQEKIITSKNQQQINLLMIHAQDHLMSTVLLIDLVTEIIT